MVIEMKAKGEDQNIQLIVEVDEHCHRNDILKVFIAFLEAMTYHTTDIKEELL